MLEQFFRCSLLVFSEKTSQIFCFTCQVLRCWKDSSGPTFLVRGFQGLCVRMLFYYVKVLSFCFYQRRFMDLFHSFRSSGIREYFQVLSFFFFFFFFVCLRVSRCQRVVLLYLGVVCQFFIKGVAWIFWLTFSGVQVSEFICQGFVVKVLFQRFSNCQSVRKRC